MKALITLFSLVLAVQVASADCAHELDARLAKSLEKAGHDYYGIEQFWGKRVIDLAKDAYLTREQVSQIGKFLQTGNYEFFRLTASQGPGGYQDLFVISKNSCSTIRRYNLYVE
jgi:hypothetical protein